MKTITFADIHIIGDVITEKELYKQIHYPELLNRYDSNFIQFKRMPSLEEFIGAANYLRAFHLERGQKHVKFYLPANEKPSKELLDYLKEKSYEAGFLELYAIDPEAFPSVDVNPDIDIQTVKADNFSTYLELQYQADLQFGKEYAKQKINLYKRHFNDPTMMQIIAYYQGEPAGSVDVIIADETAEIDGLSVKEVFQKKGIGTRLQQFVMNKFANKTIILVADGEDTPREMYRRQNYHYVGFQYEIQKIDHV
ncbi:GNAT family N-acetyltransferase [Oceanobacillus chungangensis]|uniref:GNAT family N-acetyltransferase n=1 Tax=Oceanobacillus chungangensis TaxID=1229152 RepID=A0A3D8PLT5_9BACI|nr:GNAT family N-acetyltransferase [Oceanobacillus chungangensis]RDW16198.1 GNAT family N-acetyltransferase [Oceanobacillus chungangensis]